MDVTGFSTTDRSDGFTVDFNELESGLTRVIVFDANNSNIEAGSGPILNMELVVHPDAYNSNVGINFENVQSVIDAGADMIVAGTTTFKGGPSEYANNIEKLRGH